MDNKVDRISWLPPFIIHHMMSYLSAKKVAQISILSKRWNQLRISFPIFDFHQNYFLTKDERRQITSVVEEDRLALRGRVKEFMEFVDASLLRFCELKFCMHKFRLIISILDVEESAPHIDKWIGLAIEKGVKEFDLKFFKDGDTPYSLPQTFFSARSLTTLKLFSCKLENISDTIRFNSLRKLFLEEVFINEEMMQKLSSECPLLEEMLLWECWGFKRLCVSKAPKMKIMKLCLYKIESVEIVEIGVPNLQRLDFRFGKGRMPREFNIIGCSQLKKLKFTGVGLRDQQFHHCISSFPLLEDLILVYCDFLERIMISSDQLKKFQISSCLNMKELDLDTPNLISFTYQDSPIPTSRINALCPWQVQFCFHYVTFDTQWCLKLREFLGVFNHTEAIRISLGPTMSSFKLEEFRKSFPSPLCNVGHLQLHTDVPPSKYRILLDCLLLICYPKTLSLKTNYCEPRLKLFKSFYNELKNRDVSCCNSHDIKCWRHYLKDTKVESFVDLKDKKLVGADNSLKLLSTDTLNGAYKLMKLLRIDNLSDIWSAHSSVIIKFRLDWCFPMSIEKS